MPKKQSGKSPVLKRKPATEKGKTTLLPKGFVESQLAMKKAIAQKEVAKNRFIERMPLESFTKEMFKAGTPYDGFDFYEDPLQRFFFVERKLGECNALTGVPNSIDGFEKIADNAKINLVFWNGEAKTVAMELRALIKKASGKEFKDICSKETDILLAAKEMGVEAILPYNLFAGQAKGHNSTATSRDLSKSFFSYERIGRDIFAFEGDYKTIVAHTRRITNKYKDLLVRSTTHKKNLFRIDKKALASLWVKVALHGSPPEIE